MEKSCSECPEPTLAQSLCTLCNKWLCYQCTDVHQHQRVAGAELPQQKGCSSLPVAGQGPGSPPCTLLMCHSHRQEPLELFCESCDLLCCSSCHLSSHKNHRVAQIGKALQDQQWLFESLMVQVEERRSAVENNAKQIEDRLRGVKIAHRKAENQIKMAKMIMMNELNKRANLLIEQLEKISEDFQQCLEDQLQGAIETCGQLDHVQKFITWATTHHCRGPVLFSRALISYQMQQLLEQSLHSDSWSPVKIKFNWDASYWTKQMSSLGQLTVEGGNCTFSPNLPCSSVLRPQPLSCLPVCHRGREAGCRYQLCCEPQVCCLHSVASQGDLPSLDKGQLETALCNSSCVQPARISAPLHPTHQLPRCWDPDALPQRPSPSSPVMAPLQPSCGRGAQPLASASQPVAKAYLYQQKQREPDSLPRPSADPRWLGQCQGKLSLQEEVGGGAALDGDAVAEEIWEERCRPGEALGQTSDGRETAGEEPQRDGGEQSPIRLHRGSPAAEQRKELQRSKPALRLGDHRGSKRSTSLEVALTNQECVSDVQSSRLSPGLTCARRERRSQSIPAELAAPSTSAYCERAAGCTLGQEAAAANKNTSMDSRLRRASDGILSAVTEASSGPLPSRGLRSPLLTYKTEPDHCFMYATEKTDYDTEEKSRASRNGHGSSAEAQRDPGRNRVPVVCLERLKILVSQLPPHGRRQSDPLPASGTEAPPTQSTWQAALSEGASGGLRLVRTTRSFTAPPYTERLHCHQPPTRGTTDSQGGRSSSQTSTPPSTDLNCVPRCYPALDVDSDSDPKTASEGESESSSETERECLAVGKSAAATQRGRCADNPAAGDSELSLEYEADPESDVGGGSDDSRERDADTESDVQPDDVAALRAESDSDAGSDRPPDSAESELDVESEAEATTDEPQPLRSDPEEDSHMSHRPLLIANPERAEEDVRPEQDGSEMESEDFCAVCLIGGELLCCDRCPKVFHLSCHVPPLECFPSGDWLCSLCRDLVQLEVQYDCESARTPGEHTAASYGLAACDQRKCERLTLLILSNVLSAPFQEPVSPLARHYYQIIKRPIDLSVIRAKLNKRSSHVYSSPEEFVADVCLMFRNCAKFNYPDSEVAQAGRSLEAFFIGKLKEVFPDRIFPVAEAESDSDEYDEAYRAAEGGFPWPERREQCHRKRKRRNSLKSRRNHF